MEYSELIDYSGLRRTVRSCVNSNCYYLTDEKIYVVKDDHIECEILLPKANDISDKIILFRDMYYIDEELTVIIATRDFYDHAMVLDEEKLILKNLRYTK